MGIEIERKFLVDPNGFAMGTLVGFLAQAHVQVLDQGYMSDKPAVRIRTSEDKAWITIKGKADVTQRARAEFEYEIPRADGLELLEMCRWRLSKVRYTLKLGSDVWEVDAFTGRHKGLYLAEIELESADQHFVRPSWLGAEVTTDKRYSNASLAQTEGRFWENG